jgi:hypothetical protein
MGNLSIYSKLSYCAVCFKLLLIKPFFWLVFENLPISIESNTLSYLI